MARMIYLMMLMVKERGEDKAAGERIERFLNLFFHPLRGREMLAFTRNEIRAACEIIILNSYSNANDYIKYLNGLDLRIDDDVRDSQAIKLWGCLLEAATAEIPKRTRINA